MRTRVFLSHSSVDKPFAKDLAEAWGRQNVWVDFWSLDAGAMLPQDIAESIQASKVFLLVATRPPWQADGFATNSTLLSSIG